MNRLQAAHTAASGISPYARASLHTLRAGGTSLLTGAALGYADAKWGLDVRGKHPTDGYLALAAAATSLLLANDPDGLGVEARSIMTVSSGIFAFRKAKAWAEGQKNAAHRDEDLDDDDEDPILAAARGLNDVARKAA